MEFIAVRRIVANSLAILFVTLFALIPLFALAEDFKRPSIEHLKNQMFAERLTQFANAQSMIGNSLPIVSLAISQLVSDDIATDILDVNFERPMFRDELADRALDVLVRETGKYPILIGEPGAGKSAVSELIIYKILAEDYPDTETHKKVLKDAVVFRVSARTLIPGGTDLAAYLASVSYIASELKRNIIVQIHESHFLTNYHVSVLREFADSSMPVPIILETDSKSYGNSLSGHPSFNTISRPIMIPATDPKETRAIIKEQLLPKLKTRLNVELTEDFVDTVIDLAKEYGRDAADPRRSMYLAEEFAIDWQRHGDGSTKPTRLDLYRYVARQSRFPVIPQNEEEFSAYMQELRTRIKARVLGQDPIVDGLVDQFQAALTSSVRQHSVALIMGPTGVGKTLVAEVLPEEFYGDKSRILELDMTQFADKNALTTLIGASNGFISSDKEKGVLCDFLDGPGKGGGVIILNEIEEADGEVITRLMELFDKGVIRGGDGRVRYLGRSLIVMTSNKNTDRILSYDAIRGMNVSELNRRLSQISQDQLKKAFTEKSSYTQDDSKVVKSAVLERVDRLYFASPLLSEVAVAVAQLEISKFVTEYNKQSQSEIEVDASFAEVLTSAFYNESLGARQIRTAVQQSISKALNEFKRQYGFEHKKFLVSASLHPSKKTTSFITVKAEDTDLSVTVDGPYVPVENKMLDPEFRQRLIDLEENLKSEVFGQDEAISAMVSAVKARFLRGGKEDIVAGFLLGTTGAGKSQLGKTLAKHLFGREEALGLFEMGKVQDDHDLGNIFSPPKGIIGSDQPGQLEKFLIQYPDGGVLLFDEMSNAGGNNRAMKDMIAKQFYTLIQEGTYISPTGKVYDLSKYVILMTGNDGEEVFKGLSSDSMLEEAYKEAVKKPELVRDLLRNAGFSDAFIGRLSFVQLMRPTLSPIKVLIARKMINQWKAQVEKEQPFDLIYDDEFVRQIGLLMFSPKSGARSINHFVSSTLGKAVANEVLKFDWDQMIQSGERAEVRLSLDIDQVSVPFYEGDKPYENKAILQVETYQADQLVSRSTVDFSSSANFIPQVHREIALATAYHEMGHLVATFPEITGKQPVKVTIVPEKLAGDLNALGYAQYRSKPTKFEPDRNYLIHVLAGLLAGSEAEVLIGRSRTTGRSNDVQRVGRIARRLVLEAHLVPELDGADAYLDAEGKIIGELPPQIQKVFDDYVSKAIADARALAIKTLREQWHVVEAGAQLLMEHGNLSEKDIERLLERGQQVSESASWYIRILQKFGLSRNLNLLRMSTEGIVLPPSEQKSCEELLVPAS